MGAPGIGPGSGKILEISKNPEKSGKNPAVWEILGARIAPAALVILQCVMSQAAKLAHTAAKTACLMHGPTNAKNRCMGLIRRYTGICLFSGTKKARFDPGRI